VRLSRGDEATLAWGSLSRDCLAVHPREGGATAGACPASRDSMRSEGKPDTVVHAVGPAAMAGQRAHGVGTQPRVAACTQLYRGRLCPPSPPLPKARSTRPTRPSNARKCPSRTCAPSISHLRARASAICPALERIVALGCGNRRRTQPWSSRRDRARPFGRRA